mmetsp:Transcript_43078/g.115162  ORF Transcript_43078/g.115162 Transcript_43078/m.115162 type:complete len:113 (-) Transcript_43078:597-935(-)
MVAELMPPVPLAPPTANTGEDRRRMLRPGPDRSVLKEVAVGEGGMCESRHQELGCRLLGWAAAKLPTLRRMLMAIEGWLRRTRPRNSLQSRIELSRFLRKLRTQLPRPLPHP